MSRSSPVVLGCVALLVLAVVPGCREEEPPAPSAGTAPPPAGGPAPPPEGAVLPPPKKVQEKGFAEVLRLLPEVEAGLAVESLHALLGKPQMEDDGPRSARHTWLERPGEYGTMAFVAVTVRDGKVADVEQGKISIDPW
jgi:hypothetical protein